MFSKLIKVISIVLSGTILVIFIGFMGLFVLAGLVTPKKLPEKAKESFFSHKAVFEELRQMISSEPVAYCIADDKGQLTIGPYFYDGTHWRLSGDRSNKAFSMEQICSLMAISKEHFDKYLKLLKEIGFASVHKNLISDSDSPFANELQSANSTISDKVYLHKLIHAKPNQLFISFCFCRRSLSSYIDYIPDNRARPVWDPSDEQHFEQLENHWFLEP